MNNITLGKLFLPWVWSGCFLGIWALAPTYIYHLQFVTTGREDGRGTQEQQDLAGYIGFTSIILLFVIIGIYVSWKLRHTWKLPVQWKRLIWPFIITTGIMSPWYVGTFYLYENFRFQMAYDANWAAIGGISLIGLTHYAFVTFLYFGIDLTNHCTGAGHSD